MIPNMNLMDDNDEIDEGCSGRRYAASEVSDYVKTSSAHADVNVVPYCSRDMDILSTRR